MLKSLANFLIIEDAPANCDVIFVLAGRLERKPYGWRLFQSGLARRLILSVGRYEVRQTAQQPVEIPELLRLRDNTPPAQRHFWVDFQGELRSAGRANLRETNTYWELHALAEYLAASAPRRVAIVSTSIHLRRVRLCCRKIQAFKDATLLFWPVPEDQSSFSRTNWWKHRDQAWFLLSEYVKLMAYHLKYGWKLSRAAGKPHV
jgi:hypothetical protein